MTVVKRQARGARLVEVHLRLPIEIVERLEREAGKAGLSLSAHVRGLLGAEKGNQPRAAKTVNRKASRD
jgi:hypothetical protein